MNLKTIGLFICYLCFFHSITAQEKCKPKKGLYLTANQISQGNILQRLEEFIDSGEEYHVGVIQTERRNVNKCNTDMAEKISELSYFAELYSRLRKDIYSYRDLNGLKNQLREFKSSKVKVKKDLKNDISRIERQGLFTSTACQLVQIFYIKL